MTSRKNKQSQAKRYFAPLQSYLQLPIKNTEENQALPQASLQLVHAGEEYYSAQAYRAYRQHKPHSHDMLHMLIYYEGANALALNGGMQPWDASQSPAGILIDSNCLHEVRPQIAGIAAYAQMTIAVHSVAGDHMPYTWHELFSYLGGDGSKPEINDQQWAQALIHLRHLITAVRAHNARMVLSHFLCIIDVFLCVQAQTLPKELQRLQKSIEQDPASLWNVQRLCTVSTWSAGYLHRSCRKYLKCTPMQLVHQARLDLAAELLLKSDDYLDLIAERCGFADAYHFSRRFKARFALAPGKWRIQQQRL